MISKHFIPFQSTVSGWFFFPFLVIVKMLMALIHLSCHLWIVCSTLRMQYMIWIHVSECSRIHLPQSLYIGFLLNDYLCITSNCWIYVHHRGYSKPSTHVSDQCILRLKYYPEQAFNNIVSIDVLVFTLFKRKHCTRYTLRKDESLYEIKTNNYYVSVI